MCIWRHHKQGVLWHDKLTIAKELRDKFDFIREDYGSGTAHMLAGSFYTCMVFISIKDSSSVLEVDISGSRVLSVSQCSLLGTADYR